MRRLLPRHAGARVVLAVVAFFVVVNIGAFVTSSVRPEPSGERGSAYATQPLGTAAYAELLRRSGHRVDLLREPLADTRLDPGSTVVVIEPEGIEDADRAELARFVIAGGRLVAAGRDPGSWLGPALATPPRWTSERAAGSARPTLPVPETSAIKEVRTGGRGGFESAGDALPVLGDEPSLLAVASPGDGRALLLADASPLHNRLLGRADNAALGLALAGAPQRPVTFVESVHGFGAGGLSAIPGRWQIALIGIGLACVVLLLARARRLGPVELVEAEPAPARREHVEAIALGLRRCGDPRALEPVRVAARRQVVRRAGLPDDAPDAAVRDAALGLGFEEDEADALARPAHDSRGALAVGRALAKGRR